MKQTLEDLRRKTGLEMERGFVTHRTMAEPRFLYGSIDPNDRPIGTCFMSNPETVNNGPVGSARFSTLRSWMSPWSPGTNADGEKSAAGVSVPLLAIAHSADDAVPQPLTRRIYDGAGGADKTMLCIKGASHYFAGQPQLLALAAQHCIDWMEQRRLLV